MERVLRALVVLIVSGCSSESRLWRHTPLSKKSSSRDRANFWPLAYADRTGSSVLWPLVDFDRKGFAVRPLVSKDETEWNVLFPLSHFDTDSGEGWALNGYSFGDNVGLFPLCNFGPTFNFVLPAWWWLEHGELTGGGLFPIAQFGDFNYCGPAWWETSADATAFGLFPLCSFGPGFNYAAPAWWSYEHGELASGGLFPLAYFGDFNYVGTAWWKTSADGDGAFGLAPLFTWADLRQIGPAWWHRPPGGGVDRWGVFPFLWKESDGSSLSVLPFWIHEEDDGEELRGSLIPPIWWEDSKEKGEPGWLHRRFIFPFYASIEREEGDVTAVPPLFAHSRRGSGKEEEERWISPVANGWSTPESTGLNVYPLWWSWRASDSARQMLLPFWYYREQGSERTLVTPLFGRGWDASGESRFVNFLGPLVHHTVGPDLETTSVAWPLFQRERAGDTTTTTALPLFQWRSAPDRTSGWTLGGLARWIATDDSTSFRLWPLYSQSDALQTPDPLFDWSLVARHEHEGSWSNHLFPLYASRGDERESETNALLGLGRFVTTPSGNAWRLWPLASGSTDVVAEGLIDRATLFRHEEKPAGRRLQFWPLWSTTTSPAIDHFGDSLALVGWHPHADKTHLHLGTSLLFSADRYGIDKSSWSTRVLAFFNARHEEQPEPDVLDRTRVGFLFDWFLAERRTAVAADGATTAESHYRLPLLHEYERTEDRKEWDVPLYSVHSVEEPDEKQFSVLGYGYRSVTKGEETNRDIFPFITWDTAPDTRRFSFLWRLFRYERNGDKRGGHVLFVPWGVSG